MARQFHVPGTKKYLIIALCMLVFGLWCVMDGWFPSEEVLAKHPPGEDSFYLFNKSLAILMLVGAAVFGYIHYIVR